MLSQRLFYTFLFFLVLRYQSTATGDFNQENEARIIGGNKSSEGQWPFMAALFDAKNNVACGGSVWDEWHVITAAHCLVYEIKNLSVYLGHTSVVKNSINSEYIIRVKQIIRHKYYDNNTTRFDIALLRLVEPIDMGGRHTGVRCVCSPEPMENLDLSNCRTLGWGSTYPYPNKTVMSPVLLDVKMPVLDNRACWSRSFNPHWNFCAKNPIQWHDSCRGDSGGPLVCPVKNVSPTVWSFTGITSFGAPTCGRYPIGYGYYTRVHRLLYWIEKNTRLD